MERYELEGSRKYKAAMDLAQPYPPFLDGSASNLLQAYF